MSLCAKSVSPERRATFFQSLAKLPPQRPEPEVGKPRLEEYRAGDVETDPDRAEEESVDPNAKRDKRRKSENTKSEALVWNLQAARERARALLQSGHYVSTVHLQQKQREGAAPTGVVFHGAGIDNPRYAYTLTILDLRTLGLCHTAAIGHDSADEALHARRYHRPRRRASVNQAAVHGLHEGRRAKVEDEGGGDAPPTSSGLQDD